VVAFQSKKTAKNQFIGAWLNFLAEEEAVTAIEYGLIAALIATGIIVLLTGAGGTLSAMYERIAACLAPATGTTCT
jgi:pilus assembly protein Flp/PilA